MLLNSILISKNIAISNPLSISYIVFLKLSFFSVRLIKRTIFSLWRTIISATIKIPNIINVIGKLKINDIRGQKAAATMEPRETYLVNATTMIKIPRHISAGIGLMYSITVKVVNTPFPPLKEKRWANCGL